MDDKKCQCGVLLDFVGCFDNPNTGYCCNIYYCGSCENHYINSIWDNPSLIRIDKNNSVSLFDGDAFYKKGEYISLENEKPV